MKGWRRHGDPGRTHGQRLRDRRGPNGHHNDPLLPDFAGEFSGGVRHSQTYRSNTDYAGKRVLVVGFGNSGSQIAVDVSAVADSTVLSIRRGGYVLPQYARGLRIDRAMPAWLGFLVNDYLPRPDHHFGSALPTVTAELPDRIEAGKVRVRPQVARLDGRVVEFTDGSREEVDEIIYCTGCRSTSGCSTPSTRRSTSSGSCRRSDGASCRSSSPRRAWSPRRAGQGGRLLSRR